MLYWIFYIISFIACIIGSVCGTGGGILGKLLFNNVTMVFSNSNKVGAIQAATLFVLTLGTLIYTIKQEKIKTHEITNLYACIIIGLLLGILSSFLGIGGGPINLVILYFFFSLSPKAAAQNSLFIILFSQVSSLLQAIITKTVPEFVLSLFIGMVACGILGGIVGRKINFRLGEKAVSKLFVILMGFIMLINVYNTYRYSL